VRIAIFGKEFTSNQLDYIRILTEALENKGCKLLIWKPFHDFIKDRISFRQEVILFHDHSDLKGSADLLFSVGGDGTMLHSVRLVRDSGIPIAGINLGRMGFLSSIPPAEIFGRRSCTPALGTYRRETHPINRPTSRIYWRTGWWSLQTRPLPLLNHILKPRIFAGFFICLFWKNERLLGYYILKIGAK